MCVVKLLQGVPLHCLVETVASPARPGGAGLPNTNSPGWCRFAIAYVCLCLVLLGTGRFGPAWSLGLLCLVKLCFMS